MNLPQFLEHHAGKLGIAAAGISRLLAEYSEFAGAVLATVSIAAVVPVAIRRWRELKRKEK